MTMYFIILCDIDDQIQCSPSGHTQCEADFIHGMISMKANQKMSF